MKKVMQMLKMTIVGGALFLVPFVLLIIILGKALEITRSIVIPIAERIPVESVIGLDTPRFMALFILILFCFTAGLFAKTDIAKKMVTRIETTLLSNLPGYSFIKNLGEEAAGDAPTQNYKSVLVRFDDAMQIGFFVERTQDGNIVVFIPGSPSPWTGNVFIMNEDRITIIDEATTSSVRCLQKLGQGFSEIVKG